MSGNKDLRSSAPVDFSEDEVKELAGRRARPVAAIGRLTRLVPAKATGKLASDLAAPARITRKELAVLRRAGRRPDKIASRLTPSELAAERVIQRQDTRAIMPTRKPPES
jgi:hypothetical protein